MPVLKTHRQSLSRRFSLAMISVVALLLFMFAAVAVWYSVNNFEAQLSNQLALASRLAETSLPIPLWEFNTEYLDDFIEALFLDESLVYVAILTNNQIVNERVRPELEQHEWSFFEESSLFIIRESDILYEESRVGRVQLAGSKQHFQHELFVRIAAIIALTLILIVVVSFTSIVITRRYVARPLSNLVEAATLISNGELGVHLDSHIQTIHSRDEIGVFATVFRRMTAYLQNMAAAATHFSSGDLSHEVIPQSNQDVLGGAFQRMSAYLKEMAAVATEIAEGNLTINIPLRSNTDVFGQTMHTMTKGLHSLIQQIRTSAEQIVSTGTNIVSLTNQDMEIVQRVQTSVEEMVSTMTEMGTNVSQVAQNMDVLSSSVEETLSSVSEVTNTITNIASNTTELAQHTQQTISALDKAVKKLEGVTEQTNISRQLSQETMQDALEGQQAVEQVRESMDAIQQMNLNAVDTITRFAGRSQEINTILDVIRGITEQSSLLALNASIIAAQAGSQGRGFSVIAEEMRNLATEVGSSTQNIGSIVESVQQETKTVAQMIYDGTTKIEQGVERTQQAEQRLQKINSSAQRVSRMITEIAEALQVQMTTSHDVMGAMARVFSMTDEITKATNEQKVTMSQIHDAVEQISNMAVQTQQAMSQQLEGVHRVIEAANQVSILTDQNLESSQHINRTTTATLATGAQTLLLSVDRFRLNSDEETSPSS